MSLALIFHTRDYCRISSLFCFYFPRGPLSSPLNLSSASVFCVCLSHIFVVQLQTVIRSQLHAHTHTHIELIKELIRWKPPKRDETKTKILARNTNRHHETQKSQSCILDCICVRLVAFAYSPMP